MTRAGNYESRTSRKKTFDPLHDKPRELYFDYILLPYGIFYEPTKGFLEAKKGDKLRFFNGPECTIESVTLIKQDALCDMLCRMRYGVSWKVAFDKWLRYALMSGDGKNILSREECLFVMYEKI